MIVDESQLTRETTVTDEQLEKRRAYQRAYCKRPEVRARIKSRPKTEGARKKHADYMREYMRARPEARAKRAVHSKAYHAAHKMRRAEISRKHARKKAGAASPSAAWKIGQCEICTLPSGDLHWDHDHATGTHRGWLCHNCNVALGLLRDSPLVLRAALHYLETNSA